MSDATRPGRMPTVYLPHGGGPWPFVEVPFGSAASWAGLRRYLEELGAVTPERPRALLVVSAHWEAPRPTVTTAARPGMLYDYYGFPEASYSLEWPAPGDPALAARVQALLAEAGIEAGANDRRGYDHGVFVPMMLSYPEADIPTVALSLTRGLDPAAHIAVGRALAPLRDEGVFIIGSGMSYHNMQGFNAASARAASERFDAWLRQSAALPQPERDAALIAWEQAPDARACHPREEHLLPLMVVAGAAGDDRGSAPYAEPLMGVSVSALHFG